MTQAATRPLPRIEVSGPLPLAQIAAVAQLCDAATEADGVHPLSEHVSLHLRYGGEGPDRNILLFAPQMQGGETVAGYAHLDPTDVVAGSAAEVVVHPEYRRRGFGRLLVSAAIENSPDGRLRLWAHGDQPGARALAEAMDLREVRQLWQMRRSLLSPLPPVELPPSVRLRPFRPGTDDAQWLALNARAFAGHPEQGTWTAADLQARMRESWFDPEGFLIAEEDAEMVGFHWTKVHGHTGDADAAHRHDQPGAAHGHDPIGEVYVVGVDPAHQGRRLGRAITLAGLQRMRSLGLPQAMLYVEGDNEPAKAVYTRLGFTHWDTDVMFSRPQPRGDT